MEKGFGRIGKGEESFFSKEQGESQNLKSILVYGLFLVLS